MRRLQQQATVGSAIRRYIGLLTGSLVPVAYWPCEEATSASQFGNLITPGNDLVWTGQPTLASDVGFQGSDPIPLLSLSAWTGSTGSFSSSGDDIFTTPGINNWIATFTGTVDARVWGSGSAGVSSSFPNGGGGAEFAEDTAVAVTQGNTYHAVVAAPSAPGTAGNNSSFTGDSTTVLAHGATKATSSTPGQGGTGSTAPIHHDGGNGGNSGSFSGGGGGGSGGSSGAGNNGGDASGSTGGSGATAVTGGGPGGKGANNVGGGPGPGSAPVSGPGGGGGGGSTGGNSFAGKVELIYVAGSTPPAIITRCLLHVPTTGATNNAIVLKTLISSGTLGRVELYYGTGFGGLLGFRGFTPGGVSKFDTGLLEYNTDGNPLLVSMELVQSGSSIQYRLVTQTPGEGLSGAVATLPATFAGTLGAASQVVVNPSSTIDDTAIGHITVQYALDDVTNLSDAINGWDDELAGDRFVRLCDEAQLTSVFNGNISDTPVMGPQQNKKLADLFQEIEDVDRGQLYEPREVLGLGYSTRVILMNQVSVLDTDYSQAHLAGTLEPATDDQLVRNDVTVTRNNGASINVTLPTGALSVLDPPNGVGSYSYSLAANLNADSQCMNLAQWILNVGTVDEYRYPTVTFDLSRPVVASLFAQMAILDVADFFRIFNPPAWLPSGIIKQLAFGFNETLNSFSAPLWTISINAVPESPYEGAGLTW